MQVAHIQKLHLRACNARPAFVVLHAEKELNCVANPGLDLSPNEVKSFFRIEPADGVK